MSDHYEEERRKEVHKAITALFEQVGELTYKAGIDECEKFRHMSIMWDNDLYEDDNDDY